MKKFLLLVLTLALLFTALVPAHAEDDLPQFSGLGDPALLRYVEDTVYDQLVTELDSEGYFVENVEAIYISQEYLDELAYNSQANIFFGYTLAELEAQFQGTKYVFTLGEDGQTTVQPFEDYDDTYDQVLRNVAIGTGVIVLCVTVSVVTAGAGAPAVSMIFAAAAKTATTMALSGAVFGGVSAGVVTGIKTGDFGESIKAAALAGSEGFKWGAISGAIAGGATEAIGLYGASLNGLTMDEAAIIQRETKYPLDVIKQFSSMEQYEIVRDAGLLPQMIDGKMALVRGIDLDFVDDFGRTNLERMRQGLAALDPTGSSYELHHIGQKVDSTLAILTKEEHRLGDNHSIWHIFNIDSEVHVQGSAWDAERKKFWMDLAELLGGV